MRRPVIETLVAIAHTQDRRRRSPAPRRRGHAGWQPNRNAAHPAMIARRTRNGRTDPPAGSCVGQQRNFHARTSFQDTPLSQPCSTPKPYRHALCERLHSAASMIVSPAQRSGLPPGEQRKGKITKPAIPAPSDKGFAPTPHAQSHAQIAREKNASSFGPCDFLASRYSKKRHVAFVKHAWWPAIGAEYSSRSTNTRGQRNAIECGEWKILLPSGVAFLHVCRYALVRVWLALYFFSFLPFLRSFLRLDCANLA